MACILQPKCNFLHRYIRCCLPIEAVDIEVRITSTQGMHIFRRDRTSQFIKCTPWSTRLCPHPTIIKKMRTFLEQEGKLGPKSQSPRNQFRPAQPDNNPKIRKNGKAAEKRKRPVPTKRFRVVVRPNSNKVTAQPSNTKALMSTENQETLALTSQNNPPLSEDAPICTGTPWPEAGKMLGNLFEIRKDWLIHPTNNNTDNSNDTHTATSPKPPIRIEPQTQVAPEAE